MFSALRHRNFRLYLSGQFISLIGTWMQQLATSWMVYRLTQSPLWLGISMFSTQIPSFVFGWLSGVWVDRTDKRKLLLWTQGLAGIQASVLAVLTFTGRITLAELIGLNLIVGCVNAIDMPTRQSFVVQMIGRREDLPNAIALNSSMMNGTRLIGPAIAGVTIAAFGEGPCFLLNALSYLAVLGALFAMKIEKPEVSHDTDAGFADSLKAGFHAAFDQPQIRAMLLFLGYLSIVGLPYNTLFPALAARFSGGGAMPLHPGLGALPGGLDGVQGGASTLGALTSTASAGAFTAAMYLAKRNDSRGLDRIARRAALAFGIALIALAWAGPLVLALPSIYVAGLSMMLMLACGNTVIQTVVTDEMRGRVMGLFSFALLGTSPFGSLLAGWLAEHLGLPWALTLQGALSLVGSVVYARATAGATPPPRLAAES